MKKITFAIIALVGIFAISNFTSCKKIKEAAQISVNINSTDVEFTIPVIPTVGTVDLADFTVAVNVDSILKASNADFALKNIKSVTVNSCDLTLIDGDVNNNFSALEACSVSISSPNNTTLIPIAAVTNNPDVEAYSLSVPVKSPNLTEYFKASSFSYKVSGTSRKTTSKALQCKATIKFTLKVGL